MVILAPGRTCGNSMVHGMDSTSVINYNRGSASRGIANTNCSSKNNNIDIARLPKHKIRVFGQTKTGQVGHLSEQRHVWSVMLLCNYQSSTTRNDKLH